MRSSRERQHSISSYFGTSGGANSQRNEQIDLTEDLELQQQNVEPELNEPPPKKASLASAHHRASGFNLSWQEGHTWLMHDKEQGMFCTLCKQFKQGPKKWKRGMGVQGV